MPETQTVLSPADFVEDVVPLLAGEALPSIPEEQCPTLMSKGVLDDLAPKEETVGCAD